VEFWASKLLIELEDVGTVNKGECREMENTVQDRGVLDMIGNLSAKRESGKLQITRGMTEGAFLFNKGQLLDARVGKLSGFQAINAVASMRDAHFSFDPSVPPPAKSSITPGERRLLKDFFGIDALDRDQAHDSTPEDWSDENTTPAQVVPLTEVEDRESMAALDARSTTDSTSHVAEENFSRSNPIVPEAAALVTDAEVLNRTKEESWHNFGEQAIRPPNNQEEVTLVRRHTYLEDRKDPISYPLISRSRIPMLLFLGLLTLLVATAALAFAYRNRERNAPASVAVAATAEPSASTAGSQEEKKEGTPSALTSNSPAATPNLTGSWNVVNTVEQTSYQPFKNMQVGFHLAINQNGKVFTGKGEKVSENGRRLGSSSRTPIVVKGSIDGDRVHATFSEAGTARKTDGRFVWRVDKASGGLTGTFVSTAARASGKSAATKGQ